MTTLHSPRFTQFALFGVILLAMTAGLHAQTPIESAVIRMVQVATNVSPYIATLGFVSVMLMFFMGHHETYAALFRVVLGTAIGLGAIAMVNYFRP